jgi:phytoene/squalene synthetase
MIYFSHALAFVIGFVSVRILALCYFRFAVMLRTDIERAQIATRLMIRVLQQLRPDAGLTVAALLQLAAEIMRNVEEGKREDFERRATLAWKGLEAREALEREAERKSL